MDAIFFVRFLLFVRFLVCGSSHFVFKVHVGCGCVSVALILILGLGLGVFFYLLVVLLCLLALVYTLNDEFSVSLTVSNFLKALTLLNLNSTVQILSLHVLPVSSWVLSGYSGFLPPTQDMHVRLTGD